MYVVYYGHVATFIYCMGEIVHTISWIEENRISFVNLYVILMVMMLMVMIIEIDKINYIFLFHQSWGRLWPKIAQKL